MKETPTHRPTLPCEPHLLLSGVMLAGLLLIRQRGDRTRAANRVACAAHDLAAELSLQSIPAPLLACIELRYRGAVSRLSVTGVSDWQTAALLVASGDLQHDPAFEDLLTEHFFADCGEPSIFAAAMALVIPGEDDQA